MTLRQSLIPSLIEKLTKYGFYSVLLITVFVMGAVICCCCGFQTASAAVIDDSGSLDSSLGVVSVGADRMFSVEASLGPVSAKSRAAATNAMLSSLRKNPDFIPGLIETRDSDGHTDITSGDLTLFTVTEGDANVAGVNRQRLAQLYTDRIKEAFSRGKTSRNAPAKLTASLWITGIAFGALVLGALFLVVAEKRLRTLLNKWRGKYIRTIRLKELELLREETIYASLIGLVRILRAVGIWAMVVTFIIVALGAFPMTEHLAYELKDFLWNAASNWVVPALIGYVPNLFFLVLIAFVTRYFLKFSGFLFRQMNAGVLTVPGFEREWVDPTWNIVKFGTVIFALMLAFPYLPGSGSPAFQQIAIFLGVLVSLGSTGAVSHVIAGVFLTYTGAFRLNDRVQIADTVGDVVQKSLLATKIKTIKQEYITVPNGLVLGSHIVNYSSTGTSPGLILHTTVTLGYDVPWRQAQDLLIQAAENTEGLKSEPKPFVLQTSLNDHHVAYQINAYTDSPDSMALIYSRLHQQIQDVFRDADLEILSPEYRAVRDGNTSTVPPL